MDDDPQALRYVRDVLTRAGNAPVVTADPAEVPRLMAAHKPHLALLDLLLPGTDGIELMHEVHRTADVPVIFLSVYGQDDTVARAFDMGAADYLVKPFSPTELAAPDPGGTAEGGWSPPRASLREPASWVTSASTTPGGG